MKQKSSDKRRGVNIYEYICERMHQKNLMRIAHVPFWNIWVKESKQELKELFVK